MKRRIRLLVCASFLFTISPVVFAATAIVVADEAQVYEQPDLDAPVISVVRGGTKLTVSKGVRGEYAKFHKTRVNKKIGWISVSDVKPEAEVKRLMEKAKKQGKLKKPPKGPFAEENARERGAGGKERAPLLFSRSVGIAVGMTDYTESISGVDRVANLLTYGLKITGPDVFFEGPLVDANILLHYGAPDYYEGLSSIRPTGFILWTDACLLMPLRFRDDSMVALGVGPLLVLSNITATQGQQVYTMWGLNLGATVELMAGFRLGDVALRLEGKYWFERKTYRQVQLAIQTVF